MSVISGGTFDQSDDEFFHLHYMEDGQSRAIKIRKADIVRLIKGFFDGDAGPT